MDGGLLGLAESAAEEGISMVPCSLCVCMCESLFVDVSDEYSLYNLTTYTVV